jgi:protein SCO1/2
MKLRIDKLLMAAAAMAIGIGVAPLGGAAPPNVLRDVGIDQRLDSQLPLELTFRDESGRSVKLGDYFGSQPTILVLAYYRCPMLCTQVLNGLVKTMREMDLELGKQYRVLTVSFDPSEGPELASRKKATYAESYSRPGAAEGWHFLTGDQDAIAKLTSAVGFRYVFDATNDQYAHGSAIMIATPQGRVSHYFMGIDFPSRDVRLALVEASRGQIGTTVDQLLLLCYHFDPTVGKYTASTMAFVRISAIATILLIGIPIGRAWYREHTRGDAPMVVNSD